MCEHAVSDEVSEQSSTHGMIDKWAVINQCKKSIGPWIKAQ